MSSNNVAIFLDSKLNTTDPSNNTTYLGNIYIIIILFTITIIFIDLFSPCDIFTTIQTESVPFHLEQYTSSSLSSPLPLPPLTPHVPSQQLSEIPDGLFSTQQNIQETLTYQTSLITQLQTKTSKEVTELKQTIKSLENSFSQFTEKIINDISSNMAAVHSKLCLLSLPAQNAPVIESSPQKNDIIILGEVVNTPQSPPSTSTQNSRKRKEYTKRPPDYRSTKNHCSTTLKFPGCCGTPSSNHSFGKGNKSVHTHPGNKQLQCSCGAICSLFCMIFRTDLVFCLKNGKTWNCKYPGVYNIDNIMKKQEKDRTSVISALLNEIDDLTEKSKNTFKCSLCMPKADYFKRSVSLDKLKNSCFGEMSVAKRCRTMPSTWK